MTGGVAFAGDGAFFASGLNEGGAVHFAATPSNSFSDLRDWVAKSFGDSHPTESEYVPGTFYKRIRRPLVCSVGHLRSTVSEEQYNAALVALRILLSKLQALFETIEPDSINLHAHGHKIRELLLLACMEIESAWSAILRENQYDPSRRWNTNDYVKLATPMFLDAYEMNLQSYPNFPKFSPFGNWDSNNPTASLPWYDAYNKTKHDREGNLKVATLEYAVMAVGAAVVMFCTQFSPRARGTTDQSSLIREIFNLTTQKMAKYEKLFYIPKMELSHSSQPTPTPSMDWVGIDYPFD